MRRDVNVSIAIKHYFIAKNMGPTCKLVFEYFLLEAFDSLYLEIRYFRMYLVLPEHRKDLMLLINLGR